MLLNLLRKLTPFIMLIFSAKIYAMYWFPLKVISGQCKKNVVPLFLKFCIKSKYSIKTLRKNPKLCFLQSLVLSNLQNFPGISFRIKFSVNRNNIQIHSFYCVITFLQIFMDKKKLQEFNLTILWLQDRKNIFFLIRWFYGGLNISLRLIIEEA